MIKNNKKTMKTIVFSIGLAMLLLTATNLHAQYDGSRGLFGMGKSSADNDYSYNRDRLGPGESSVTVDITNEDFEPAAPIGSGIAILIGAGLGYVALKKKEDKQ